MRFRNGLRLLMENFKHVYNLLLSKLIVSLVATAICCAFVLPELLEVWSSAQVQGLVENLKGSLKILLSADQKEMETLKESLMGPNGSFGQVVGLLGSMRWEILLTCIGCAVVYLLKRFVETICHFTTGSMLNDKMSTYAETPYITAFVTNIGKASAYSAVYVPIVFLFDVVMIALAYAFLAVTPIFVGLFGAMTIIVCCQALKLTFTSRWLPAMTTDNKKLREAMRCADKQERRRNIKAFSSYLVAVYFIVIINVAAAFFTFGSALILTVPASYFFLICLQYVNYYTLMGKKYFLTYEHIATNPNRGDSEHFFDYMCDTSDSGKEENK
jgi:hypothetical protein